MLTSLELYEKVDKLRMEKGLKVADLNRLAGISHGTLPSWKQRGTMPKLEVLEGICEALGIPLTVLLFDVDASHLTAEEVAMLSIWRQLDDKHKEMFMSFMKAVARIRSDQL